eukprot:553028_1
MADKDFQNLTYLLKLRSMEAFQDEDVVDVIYNAINFGEYADSYDILDDINNNDSYIAETVSTEIKNNKHIIYEWKDTDNLKLTKILFNIYQPKANEETPTIFQRSVWKSGSTCEIYLKSLKKWNYAEIISISQNDSEWLLLKCTDLSLRKIQRYSKYIRPASKDPTNTNLSRQLISELGEALDATDKSHNFLYQIYQYKSSNINKFLSCNAEKAMQYYRTLINTGSSISMLFNGFVIKQIGDDKLCFICIAEAKKDYKEISSVLQLCPLNKTDIAARWRANGFGEQWLVSTEQELVIAEFTQKLDISTLQLATKVYEGLFKYADIHSIATESILKETNQNNKIMFLWSQQSSDLAMLDTKHLLYIAFLMLEKFAKIDNASLVGLKKFVTIDKHNVLLELCKKK